MEMMQLQMLVAVAEEHTLQRAASRVHRTQPAVSIAIAKLEEEVGAKLLDRSQGREFRLTSAGDTLVRYARRLLSLRDEAVAAVDEIRAVKVGHIRVGANQSIGEYVLPQLVKDFRDQYPEVKIRIAIGYSDAMLSALKHHQLDIALIAGQATAAELRSQVILRDRLVAIVPPNHHLARIDRVHIQDLAYEPLVVLTDTSELRERISQVFKRFRVVMNVQVETETLESIKNISAAGSGVGIVPSLAMKAKGARGDLVVKVVEEFHQERSLWLVSRPNSDITPACQAFMKIIKHYLKALALNP
jgi:DNA-binding transcriptional LysR family regulator